MVKYLAGLLVLAFATTTAAQTKPTTTTKPASAPAKTTTKSPSTTAQPAAKTATAPVVLKKEDDKDFCPEFKKVLAAAKDGFNDIKGDTIRKTKSIIIASKVTVPGWVGNRLSHDLSINQTFYRGFVEGEGNLSVVKSKFEGVKSKIKNCLPKGFVEKNKESESKTDYNRLLIISEHPQDSKSKEYKGLVIEIETEYDVAAAADYDISITITYYK